MAESKRVCNLKRVMDGAGVTRYELAKRMRVSEKTVERWERSQTAPRTIRARELAHVLGCRYDDLFEEGADDGGL